MQEGDSPTGQLLPRKEGMEFFYNKMLPKAVESITKKIDPNAKIEPIDLQETDLKVLSIPMTDAIKTVALEQGFSLFQKDQGRITFGPDGKSIIEIFNNKNPSTFIHEIGHYYLEMLGALAEDSSTPQQVKDDWASILKFLNVSSRAEIGVEQHELFARANEAFLMEGKAPSSELKGVFHRFKSWLLNLYQNVRALKVELSDEMRDVFGRLYAAQKESESIQDELFLYSTDPSTYGMTGDMAEKYKAAREEAKTEAEAMLAAEVMEGWIRTQKVQWKKKRSEIKKQVEQDANEMPVYKALSVLQFGKNPDGTPAASKIKLNREALVKEFGIDLVKRLPKPFIYSREDGVHHDVVAPMFGFNDGKEMIDTIMAMPAKKDFIDAEAARRHNEDEPDMMTTDPVAMTDAAINTVHNTKHDKFLRLTLDYMWENAKSITKETARRTIAPPASDASIKQAAVQAIGRRSVRELRPHVYYLAEKRAMRAAAKAWTAGDLETAYQETYRANLNSAMYRAAMTARADVKKRTDRLKKIFRKDEDLAKTREINYVLAARAILAEFGLGQPDKTVLSYLAPLRAYDEDAYLSAAIQIESLDDIPRVDNFKDMDYSDFERMTDVVGALWDLSKQAKEIEVEGKKVEIQEAKEKLLAQMQFFKDKKNLRQQFDEDADKWDRTKTQLLGVKSMLRRFEHWISSMDMGPRGAFRQYLFAEISRASDKFTLESKKYKEKIKAAAGKIQPYMIYEKIDAPELGFRFQNKGQILAAMSHVGNESNLKKLLVGRGWGTLRDDGTLDTSKWDAFLDRAHREGLIRKDDWDFVQTLWDINEEVKPLAQKAHKKMFGYYFNEITTQTVKTPFGDYRGGYMPAMIDPEPPKQGPARAYSVGDLQKLEQMAQGLTSYVFPAAGGKGFTKSRVEDFNKPLLLDITKAGQHVNAVLKFSYVKPAVIDSAKLVLSPEFRESIAELDPTIINEMILPALNRADKQQIQQIKGKGPAFVSQFANYLRTSAAMQIMFANVQNILEQPTGLAAALVKVKPKYMTRAMTQLMKSPKELMASITEKSNAMAVRYDSQIFDIDRRIADIFEEKNQLGKMQDWAQKHMYFGQSFMQNVMDTIVWTAAYDQAVEQGETELNAVSLADSTVRETQGSIRPMDISVAESNPFLRIFQMFMGFFNNIANLNVTEFRNIYYSGMSMKQKYARGLYVYTMAFGSMAVLSAALKKVLSGKGADEDEDGEYIDDAFEVIFGSQVRFATAMVPVVGPAIQAGLNRATPNPMDDRVSASPAITAITTIVGTPVSLAQRAASGDELKRRDIKDAMTATGILLGLPVGPASRPITYMHDVSTGEAQPSGAVDFVRGLTTGQ
jgi:hypothetical protein